MNDCLRQNPAYRLTLFFATQKSYFHQDFVIKSFAVLIYAHVNSVSSKTLCLVLIQICQLRAKKALFMCSHVHSAAVLENQGLIAQPSESS